MGAAPSYPSSCLYRFLYSDPAWIEVPLETLIALDTRLRTLVLRAIIARWRAGERDIASHDLYAQLIEAGAVIPVGAMAVVFDNLRMLKLIGRPFPENSMAIRIHGDMRITWLHPRLL